MSSLTIEDLRVILNECAGDDDAAVLGGGALDTSFLDLGYDSLALLEAAAVVKRRYGVEVSDQDLHDIDTPRAFLEKINVHLVGS
ncbi:MAG TPA: acyl carrier protein [Catenuloplanes sp.]|jgi:act minimal PKS acyl carrier protein